MPGDRLFILLEPPSPEVQAERLREETLLTRPNVASRWPRAGIAQARELKAICIVSDLDATVAEVQRLDGPRRRVVLNG